MVNERPRKKGKRYSTHQVSHELTSRFCIYWCSTLFNYNRYSCTGAFFGLIEWLKDCFLDLCLNLIFSFFLSLFLKTKWSRTLWLLSKSSALSSCSAQRVGLKGKPICFDVSHNHVDSSANSALKAIAFLTLSIVTIVSPPCLSSNLPAYLGSALVKIMPINGCCGF